MNQQKNYRISCKIYMSAYNSVDPEKLQRPRIIRDCYDIYFEIEKYKEKLLDFLELQLKNENLTKEFRLTTIKGGKKTAKKPAAKKPSAQKKVTPKKK